MSPTVLEKEGRQSIITAGNLQDSGKGLLRDIGTEPLDIICQ